MNRSSIRTAGGDAVAVSDVSFDAREVGVVGGERIRPEAVPRLLGDLDGTQQEAFCRIVGLLHDAVARRPGIASRGREVSPVAVAHPSHSILVAGDRGMGKTTLLRSLEAALTRSDFGQAARAHLGGSCRQTADTVESLPRQLVWLETLDMEPLSRHANLLGAVLARVEQAVDREMDPNPQPDGRRDQYAVPPMLMGQTPGFHDAMQDLGSLQTAVALTFEGNLAERAGGLDPDLYAIESRRAERQRLGIDGAFARVLAALSEALHATTRWQAPLFVLPVDDLDLNLRDCASLLQLLRAASSPHLVVILAADPDLLSTVFELTYQGHLGRIAAPVPLTDRGLRVGRDLASEVLRKYLPPTHRVHLNRVDPAWALDFRPFDDVPKLRDLLPVVLPVDTSSVLLDSRLAPRSHPLLPRIRAFFAGFVEEQGEQGEVVTTSIGTPLPSQADPRTLSECLEGYSWPEALRIPLRRLVDLYLDIRSAGSHPFPEDPARGAFARHAANHLKRWPRETRPRTDEFMVRAEVGSPRREDGERTVPSDPRPVVHRRDFRGWGVTQIASPLPTAEARSYVGCLELISAGGARPCLPPLRQTHLDGGQDTESVIIAWPWVTHSTFWGYERAVNWLRQADREWEGQPSAAFGSWVSVMTAQLFDVSDDPEHPLTVPTRAIPRDWPALATRLEQLAQEDTLVIRDWLVAVGLLCTPELGLRDTAQLPRLIPSDIAEIVDSMRDQRLEHLPGWATTYVDSWRSTA